MAARQDDAHLKGYDITPTDLKPVYPAGYECSPLTSLYASWIDVDGSRRDEIHSGVDGGRLNDEILAPAPGTVRAVWKADWGWGREGALLIVHKREELGLRDGPAFYYSEFDHLRWDDGRVWVDNAIITGRPALAAGEVTWHSLSVTLSPRCRPSAEPGAGADRAGMKRLPG